MTTEIKKTVFLRLLHCTHTHIEPVVITYFNTVFCVERQQGREATKSECYFALKGFGKQSPEPFWVRDRRIAEIRHIKSSQQVSEPMTARRWFIPTSHYRQLGGVNTINRRHGDELSEAHPAPTGKCHRNQPQDRVVCPRKEGASLLPRSN